MKYILFRINNKLDCRKQIGELDDKKKEHCKN
jgi:hypothetical protein